MNTPVTLKRVLAARIEYAASRLQRIAQDAQDDGDGESLGLLLARLGECGEFVNELTAEYRFYLAREAMREMQGGTDERGGA